MAAQNQLLALFFPALIIEATRIHISDTIINTTDERFVSYTIDSNQLVHNQLNFSDPTLTYLTSQWPSYLRVGGTDGDYIYYEVGDENPCHLPNQTNQSHPYYCLSMKTMKELIHFAAVTDSKLVFSLSFGYPTYPQSDTLWNSTNTKQFLQYLHDNGYNSSHVYGFELGNELAPNDPYNDAYFQSNAFISLRNIIDSVWGKSNEFKLFGPDPHSYILRDADSTFKYMPEFVAETCSVLDGVTYHSYVNKNATALLTPDGLNEQYRESVRVSNIWNENIVQNKSEHCRQLVHHIWAGEIAEHNGGGAAGITNTFLDGFWYMDSLGTLSDLGHAVFARQCLSHAPYSLLEDDYSPKCDYYTALLFNQLMSNKVIKIHNIDPYFRVYAHCTVNGGINKAVTVAFINLNERETLVEYDGDVLFGDVYIYILSAGDVGQGLESTTIALNGEVLTFENGTLPKVHGQKVEHPEQGLILPGLTYGFLSFAATNISVCG